MCLPHKKKKVLAATMLPHPEIQRLHNKIKRIWIPYITKAVLTVELQRILSGLKQRGITLVYGTEI